MADSMPIELPAFQVIREGSSLKPSLRIVGRVNGQPVNVPANDKAKALAALERLLPAFVSGVGSVGIRAVDEPVPSEPSLAEIFAAVQVLIVNGEQVNNRLAAIEEHLAGAVTEEPPTPDPEETDLWASLLGATEEPGWVMLPQPLFSREKALTQAWWGYSPINGSQVLFEPDATKRRSFLRAIWLSDSVDSMPPLEAQFWTLMQRHGISWDEAAYAVLVGLIRPFDWGGLSGRADDEFVIVAGKSLERLWHDVADIRGGGTPSGNEG